MGLGRIITQNRFVGAIITLATIHLVIYNVQKIAKTSGTAEDRKEQETVMVIRTDEK